MRQSAFPGEPQPIASPGDPSSGEAPTDPLLVRLDRFEGPLDLLLHLIRKQDIDIFDIPIAHITEQFLEAIAGAEILELERAGDFLEMAATLVRIKAQLLFPRREEEEFEDPRADLVRWLLEYEHFREVADALEQAERERVQLHAKGFVQPRPRAAVADAPLEVEWDTVWAAALALARRLEEPEPEAGYRITKRVVHMDEKIDHILQLLTDRGRIEFMAVVEPWGTRMHAVVSLLACLELAKRSHVRLRQSSAFGPLWIFPQELSSHAA